MAVVSLPVYSSVEQADTAATPNTIALRDNSGNINGVQINGSEIKSTGILTLPPPPVKTSSFTVDTTSFQFVLDATSGNLTATLPPANSCSGRTYAFNRKDSSANTCTIKGNGTDNINAANTTTLASAGATIRMTSDGTQWWTW